jgi:cystine transport system permease protein
VNVLELWLHYGPTFLSGLVVTLELLVTSTTIALAIGLLGAAAILWSPAPSRLLATAYVQFVRSTPAIVIIFVVFYGLPELGVILPVFPAAALSIAIFGGAYFVEIFRAGFNAVDRGQWEAGYALGLRRSSILRSVITPQAIPIMLPPAVNMVADLLKTTSLVVVIGLADLMNEAYIAVSDTYRAMELYALAGAMYLAVALPLIWSIGRLERVAGRYRLERGQA